MEMQDIKLSDTERGQMNTFTGECLIRIYYELPTNFFKQIQ